eukprot:TRINITY_DN7039_c0_g1_i1.p1 TRINITY_DN7039_c0_g1~~TRINITY_DN7039_c0_g1_i1.p1  ORF type:complete len:1022 (-),score=245.72 TRINITY_DN7039_c0_g1_i1:211-3276(-)
MAGRPREFAKRSSVVVVENKRRLSVAPGSQHASPPGMGSVGFNSADTSSAAEGERFRGAAQKYDPKLLEEMLRNHAGPNKDQMHSVKDSLESCIGTIKSQVDSLYMTSEEPPQPTRVATAEAPSHEPELKKNVDFRGEETLRRKTRRKLTIPVIKGPRRKPLKISSPQDSGEESEEEEEDLTALPSGVEEHCNVNKASGPVELEDSDDDEITADDVENFNLQTSTLHVQELLSQFQTEKRTVILEELQSIYSARKENTDAETMELDQKEEVVDGQVQEAEGVKQQVRSDLDGRDFKAYRMLKRYCNNLQNLLLYKGEQASATQQGEKERNRLKQLREELRLAYGNFEDKLMQNPPDVLEVAAIMQDEIRKMERKLSLETTRIQAYEHAHKILLGALETGSDAPMEDYVTAQVIREVRKWELDGGIPEKLEEAEVKHTAENIKSTIAKLKLEYEDLRRRLKREEDSNDYLPKVSRSKIRREAKALRATKFFGEEKIAGDIFWQPTRWINILLIDDDVQERYKKEVATATEANQELEHYIGAYLEISHFAANLSPTYEESISRVREILKSSKVKVDKEIGRLPVELSPEEQEVEDSRLINAEMDRLQEERHHTIMEEMHQREEELTHAVQKEKQRVQEMQGQLSKAEKPLQAIQTEINMRRACGAPALDFGIDLEGIKASDTERLMEFAKQREETFGRYWEIVRKAAERSVEKNKASHTTRPKMMRSGTKNLNTSRTPQRGAAKKKDEVGGEEVGEHARSSSPPVEEDEEAERPISPHRHALLPGVLPREKFASPSKEDSRLATRESEEAATPTRLRFDSEHDADPAQETYQAPSLASRLAKPAREKAATPTSRLRLDSDHGRYPARETNRSQEALSLGSRPAVLGREEATTPTRLRFDSDLDTDPSQETYQEQVKKANNLFEKWQKVRNLVSDGELRATIEHEARETPAKSRAAPRESTKAQQVSRLDGGGEAPAELKEAISATIKTARSSVAGKRGKSASVEVVKASEAAVAKMATRSSKP